MKKANNNKKSTVKWELIRQCYEKGHSKDEINALLKFIDWIIRLPDDLNIQISEKIEKLEEEYKMPYMTSWERMAEERGVKIGKERGVKIGKERGVKIGKEQGVKIGKEQGIKTGKLETARELIKNGIDVRIIAQSTGFTVEEIKNLAETVH